MPVALPAHERPAGCCVASRDVALFQLEDVADRSPRRNFGMTVWSLERGPSWPACAGRGVSEPQGLTGSGSANKLASWLVAALRDGNGALFENWIAYVWP